MPRPVVGDVQPSFAGGLNTVSDPSAVLPVQVRDATNAQLDEFGAVRKRRGSQRVHASVLHASGIQRGLSWRKANGTQEILAVANGTLYTTTYGSFPRTWTAVSGTVATGLAVGAAVFQDATGERVYLADGGPLNKYDGTSVTVNLAGTPSVTQVVAHNARLWGCGDSATPDSIYYSAINNGDTLGVGASSGGQIIVRTFGDQAVTALASVGESLLIFHTSGLSRLTGWGQDDIAVAPSGITSDVGTVAPRSVCVVGNVCYFVTERGLWRTDGATVQEVSSPERPDPLQVVLPQLSASTLAAVTVTLARARRELWVYVPTVGVYAYQLTIGAWAGPWDTGWLSPAVTDVWEVVSATGQPLVWAGDASGWVRECDRAAVYLDNVASDGTGGTSFALSVLLHRMYCGDPSQTVALRWGYVLADPIGAVNASLTVSTENAAETVPLNQSGGVTGWDEAGETWDGGGAWDAGGSRSVRVPLGVVGTYADVRVTDSGAGETRFARVEIQGFTYGRR